MNKSFKNYLCLVLFLFVCVCLVGCNDNSDNVKTLRIYNWEDYIDDGTNDDEVKEANSVMEDWQEWYYETYGEKVEVVYDTFATNEIMLNTLKTGKAKYDLICPSEYAIQKMIVLDMIEKYDYDLKDKNGDVILDNYQYVSPYLKNLFRDKGWEEYSIPYMWGTLGFIYNPDLVDYEDIIHWDILWDKEYKNLATAKDSVRDTYVIGSLHHFYDELMDYKAKYENGEITANEYHKIVEVIMNRCDDETLAAVEKELKEMKENLYGFEVDNGKSDIVTGKIAINFAWSGDAVYSMDTAEYGNGNNPVYLNYEVPEEGSNIFFDGWVMPKGADIELAQSFVNFLCSPEIAVRNMNFIGYTSSVVSNEVLDMINEWYGVLPYYDDEVGGWYFNDSYIGYDSEATYSYNNGILYMNDEETLEIDNFNVKKLIFDEDEEQWFYEDQMVLKVFDEEADSYLKDGKIYIGDYEIEYEDEFYEADLSYLFRGMDEEAFSQINSKYIKDGKVVVYVYERGRQFDAQYPSEEVITRCAIMEDFGDRNEAVLDMWENVKIGDIPISITIIVIVSLVVILGIVYSKRIIKYNQKKKHHKMLLEEKQKI